MAGKRTKFGFVMELSAKSLRQRPSRAFISLASLSIAGCLLSALWSLYYDVHMKMNRELRRYGANLVIYPSGGEGLNTIQQADLDTIVGSLDKHKLVGVTPYLFSVARINSQSVILAGVWLDEAKKVNPYWRVEGEWPDGRKDAAGVLAGAEAAQKLGIKVGQTIRITDHGTGKAADATVRGIVRTGSQEDTRIYADLALVGDLTQKPGRLNVAYVSIVGGAKELEGAAKGITESHKGICAAPIRQISRSEGLIIAKISWALLLISLVIFLVTILCVGATLMATVLERKKEIGLKKALGASNGDVFLEFLSESLLLGLGGGAIGYLSGALLAQIIEEHIFGGAVTFRQGVIPLTVLAVTFLSVVASIVPIKAALKIEPALVLKGE